MWHKKFLPFALEFFIWFLLIDCEQHGGLVILGIMHDKPEHSEMTQKGTSGKVN
jgi:hypothetical protein